MTSCAETRGVALTVASYLWPKEANAPRPSIRLTANAQLSDEDVAAAVAAVSAAVREVLVGAAAAAEADATN